MELSLTAAVLLGLLMAGWTIGAAVVMLRANARVKSARLARTASRRLGRMIEQSPAIPMIIRGDGAIEGSERLASWLGLDRLPGFVSELQAEDGGLQGPDLLALREAVRQTQKTAAPFHMQVTPRGSRRSLALRGQQADQGVAAGGAALVWWFDFSEYQDELERLAGELQKARGDFSALAGVIEAAPIPMWFRAPDLKLRLVNRAYAEAVGMEEEAVVVRDQLELIEPQYGRLPAQVAEDARRRNAPVERTVSATIRGQRRAMRVCDIPMGDAGIAGFAIDVEDQEAHERTLRAHDDARRAMLDLLSAGVAQFDYERRLVFANKPFQRLFGLTGTDPYEDLAFNRFLDLAREKGRVPESGEYPVWRREMGTWFERDAPVEEAWALSDGIHLRMAGLPMPDGGLVLLAEDQTEHLLLSATRDTLLRTRAAIFDNLSEALAVFSPDGNIQSWNRRFIDLCGLPEAEMQAGLHVDRLVEALSRRFASDDQAETVEGIVRSATLDRNHRVAQVGMTDGTLLTVAGVPLPDGNGLLTIGRQGEPLAAAEPFAAEPDRPDLSARPAPLTRERLAMEEIAPFAFLTALVRDREDAVEEKELTLNLRGSRNARPITADPAQLSLAIGVLVDHVIAGAPEAGSLQITLSRSRRGAEIAITGDREGGGHDDRQVADARLAREIIEAHGGALHLRSNDAESVARIILP